MYVHEREVAQLKHELSFEQIDFSEVWMISSILGKQDLKNQCILTIARGFDSFAKDQKCLRWTTTKEMEALLSSPWLWAPSENVSGEMETKLMTQSRSDASAATVEHKIVVFGGYNGSEGLDACEKYSPSEDVYVLSVVIS
nr:kelch protein 10 [Hymenolepis microstoma]CUU98185.1 kelch protein 10 [Hymenolepis microstoma]